MALKDTSAAKLYLFGYNLVQFFGWSYGLIIIVGHVLATGGKFTGAYDRVQLSLTIFQSLQLIEVGHCLVRLVPSNAFQTFVQIFSRLVVVWGILLPVADSRTSIGVPMLLIAWSLAEMTRYMYYALNIYDQVPYVLTWLRYTLFIVLYPLGVSGELLTMVAAIPYIRDSGLYSLSLPNFANFSFYYHYGLVAIMLGYIPFFPQLYFYMIAQRKKVLGTGSPTINSKSSTCHQKTK
ncbi:very-long-chain (3R)-3-hydroxyacyl-CoA dehydratase hpo-8-like [Oppia nitens]|uniref:very-long-chain (3R)-3-hydroxyacyl-CoA dehydratase hpo-8-like n=1 Tax=Oppia nitens TaxID=1686743 RepID=UPI0023DC0656|nr:very-long-chain (3R)-3-hydroxyacyl-CoA dehydratase hpo-8-like [Oppia nitens]